MNSSFITNFLIYMEWNKFGELFHLDDISAFDHYHFVRIQREFLWGNRWRLLLCFFPWCNGFKWSNNYLSTMLLNANVSAGIRMFDSLFRFRLNTDALFSFKIEHKFNVKNDVELFGIKLDAVNVDWLHSMWSRNANIIGVSVRPCSRLPL